MIRPSRPAAFTLVELITVIALIAILAGLVALITPLVHRNGARARAEGEIKTLSGGLESYKIDNGSYPQDPQKTDALDPRQNMVADASQTGTAPYSMSSRFLYESLTGDTNDTGKAGAMTKNYAPDFWKASRLGGIKTDGVVTTVGFIADPFGNSYGYSTAGLADEQQFRQALATPSTAGSAARKGKGYNPTFDLWSTAGDTLGNTAKWAKNW